MRTDAEFLLTSHEGRLTSNPAIRKEDKAYDLYIGPYSQAFNIKQNKRRIELFNLKYFEPEDEDRANFVEGWLNGKLSFTRFDGDEQDNWYRDTGVSAFEATLRIEPIVVIENDNPLGVLASLGLLYHLFPSKKEDPGWFSEIGSDYVRRIGVSVGAGAIENDGWGFAAGAAFQVRALSFWAIYDEQESDWTWAVGIAEWDWLKKVIPYFGM